MSASSWPNWMQRCCLGQKVSGLCGTLGVGLVFLSLDVVFLSFSLPVLAGDGVETEETVEDMETPSLVIPEDFGSREEMVSEP